MSRGGDCSITEKVREQVLKELKPCSTDLCERLRTACEWTTELVNAVYRALTEGTTRMDVLRLTDTREYVTASEKVNLNDLFGKLRMNDRGVSFERDQAARRRMRIAIRVFRDYLTSDRVSKMRGSPRLREFIENPPQNLETLSFHGLDAVLEDCLYIVSELRSTPARSSASRYSALQY
jgi:hypothetical protein